MLFKKRKFLLLSVFLLLLLGGLKIVFAEDHITLTQKKGNSEVKTDNLVQAENFQPITKSEANRSNNSIITNNIKVNDLQLNMSNVKQIKADGQVKKININILDDSQVLKADQKISINKVLKVNTKNTLTITDLKTINN